MVTARVARPAAVALSLLGIGALAAAAQIAGNRARVPVGARAATTVRSGSFTQLNSHAGLSIFSAANLAPGRSATGVVVIRNAGTLGGRFTLSASDLSDTPGPRGGLLSERLSLTVVDVTAPGSPTTVYAGTLAAMPPRALGSLRAGEARAYRFSATLVDGGSPPSTTGGDNVYAGSSARVRFVWDATEATAPTAPIPPPRGDRRAPRLRLSIPSVQRVVPRGYLVVRARCDETCRLGVSGTVRTRRSGRAAAMRPIRGVRSARGHTTPLRVRLPARSVRALRLTLLRGGTVTLRLTVVARDQAGNRTTSKRTVRLRRQ